MRVACRVGKVCPDWDRAKTILWEVRADPSLPTANPGVEIAPLALPITANTLLAERAMQRSWGNTFCQKWQNAAKMWQKCGGNVAEKWAERGGHIQVWVKRE